MCKVSDGISHLNPFICKECGFELPERFMSNVEDVCMDCEKEIRHPLHQDFSVLPSIELDEFKPRLASRSSNANPLCACHLIRELAQSSEPFPF